MVKLILGLILLAASWLVIFPAPHIAFWKLSVGITSYAYVCVLLALALAITAAFGNKYVLLTSIIASLAAGIYCLPIIRAWQCNGSIHIDLQAALPLQVPPQNKKAFSLIGMFGSAQKVPFITKPYYTDSLHTLTFDYYEARTNKKVAPLVIVIHGGSWQSGDSKQLPELNSYLALQGYNVAAINYSLAPAYKSPQPEYDTKAAIQYFINNSLQYKVDTSRIVLLGRSAGAQIALCAAYKYKLPCLKGVINFYGPADMVWAGKLPPNAGVLDNKGIYNAYLGGLYSQVPAMFELATAVTHVTPAAPATLTIHGQIDPLVFKTHAEHLHKKLNEANVPNYYLKLYNATHGCDYSLQSPAGQLSSFAVMHFLKYVTQ